MLRAANMPESFCRSAADIAGLQLKPQHLRCFDEHVDIVHCDLVLVMDRPDLTDVSAMQYSPMWRPHYLSKHC